MARCHIADAGAVTLNIVIHEVEETGGRIAHHPHEFGHKRGAVLTSLGAPRRMRSWETRGHRGTGHMAVATGTTGSLWVISER